MSFKKHKEFLKINRATDTSGTSSSIPLHAKWEPRKGESKEKKEYQRNNDWKRPKDTEKATLILTSKTLNKSTIKSKGSALKHIIVKMSKKIINKDKR